MTSSPPVVVVRTLVQVADYPVGATFGPRPLDDYEFVWILRGSARWRVVEDRVDPGDGRVTERVLTPGTLALARAGTVDSYRWDPVRASTHAYVHFRVPDPGRLPGPGDWPSTRTLAELPVLDGLCGYLLDLAGQGSDAARRRSDELVALMLDVFISGPVPAADPAWPPALHAMVAHVRRVWSSEGLRIVAVDELGAAAHVSAGHVFRLFREQLGAGPARVLELVRLARAAVSLQRSNAGLGEVATLTGFANAYHFSRRFAQVYGVPPGTFRRERAGADPQAPLRDAGLLPLAHALASA